MKDTITLRRAAKIRNRLTERLLQLSVDLNRTSAMINIYNADTEAVDSLHGAAEDYNAAFVRFLAVSRSLLTIRTQIDAANAEAGVNALLAERVARLGTLRIVKNLKDMKELRPSAATISGRITGQRERQKVASGYSQEEIEFPFVTEEMRTAASEHVGVLQSRLDVIQDELETINATIKITLSESDISVIDSEGLV